MIGIRRHFRKSAVMEELDHGELTWCIDRPVLSLMTRVPTGYGAMCSSRQSLTNSRTCSVSGR
jgi:hypothetical protein